MAKFLKRPSDNDLSELADLACIPLKTEERATFSEFIVHRLLPDLLIFGKKQHHDQGTVSQTVKAARAFKLKIAKLNPKDRKILIEQSLEDEINLFLERAVGPHEFLRKSRMGQRGHPLDAIKNRELRQMVWGLLFIAELTGGRFTFSEKNKTGTLIKALRLLEPFVPAGVVPPVLPYSTIATWKSKISRRNNNEPLLDRFLLVINPETEPKWVRRKRVKPLREIRAQLRATK